VFLALPGLVVFTPPFCQACASGVKSLQELLTVVHYLRTEHDGAVLVAGVDKVADLDAGGRADGRGDGDLKLFFNLR
jgi:hypothetical protein